MRLLCGSCLGPRVLCKGRHIAEGTAECRVGQDAHWGQAACISSLLSCPAQPWPAEVRSLYVQVVCLCTYRYNLQKWMWWHLHTRLVMSHLWADRLLGFLPKAGSCPGSLGWQPHGWGAEEEALCLLLLGFFSPTMATAVDLVGWWCLLTWKCPPKEKAHVWRHPLLCLRAYFTVLVQEIRLCEVFVY